MKFTPILLLLFATSAWARTEPGASRQGIVLRAEDGTLEVRLLEPVLGEPPFEPGDAVEIRLRLGEPLERPGRVPLEELPSWMDDRGFYPA